MKMMKNMMLNLLVAGLLVMFIPPVLAAEKDEPEMVRLTFELSREFRDFKTEMGSRESDQERLKKEMNRQLKEAVKRYLPEGHRLDMQFQDIDMAGEIFPSFESSGRDVRVVKNAYPPKLEFTYQWFDENGQKVLDGLEVLKGNNVNWLSQRASSRARGSLAIERVLLDEWLRKLRTYWRENHGAAAD